MATNEAPMSPMLTALHYIQRDTDLYPDPRKGDFQYCRALVKTKERQCKRELSKQNKALANAMLAAFQDANKLPTDDSFYATIEKFLVATHCSQHYTKPIHDKFRKWKETRLTTIITARLEEIEIVGDDLSEDGTFADDSLGAVSVPEFDDFLTSSPISDLTAGFSTLNIAATQQSITVLTEDTIVSVKETQEAELGQIHSPVQRGSVRNEAPMNNAFHEPLTESEQKEGIVYVYQHEKLEGVFKIGFTRRTAKKRRDDHKNCYTMDTKLVYHTEGGPFFGARRVERLAQTMLRRQKLNVKVCRWCRKGHNEWFEAPREQILDTVRMMESFVQLPGYELRNGKYKVSTDGYEIIEQLCSFTPERMKRLMDKKLIQCAVEASPSVRKDSVMTARQSVILTSPPPPTVTETSQQIPQKEGTPGGRAGPSEIPWRCQNWEGVSFFADEFNPFTPEPAEEEGRIENRKEGARREVSPEQMAFGLMLSMMPREIEARHRSQLP